MEQVALSIFANRLIDEGSKLSLIYVGYLLYHRCCSCSYKRITKTQPPNNKANGRKCQQLHQIRHSVKCFFFFSFHVCSIQMEE